MSEVSTPNPEDFGNESKLKKLWGKLKSKIVPSQTREAKKHILPKIALEEDTSTQKIEFKKAEELLIAPHFFYHTTPDQNLVSIKEQGLFSEQGSNLADSIGYSLFYANEHSGLSRTQEPHQIRTGTPNHYSLTVWSDLKSEVRMPKDSLAKENRHYQPKTPVEGSEQYIETKLDQLLGPGGNFREMWRDHYKQTIQRLAPNYLSAEIPLHQHNRDLLIKAMVLLQTGKQDATTIQGLIEQGLQGQYLEENKIDNHTLAQGLTSSIVHHLLRASIMPEIENLKAGTAFVDKEKLTAKVLKARSIVNDQSSARYLDQLLTFLHNGQKVTEYNSKEIENTQFDLTPRNVELYYGFSGGGIVAAEIAKELSHHS